MDFSHQKVLEVRRLRNNLKSTVESCANSTISPVLIRRELGLLEKKPGSPSSAGKMTMLTAVHENNSCFVLCDSPKVLHHTSFRSRTSFSTSSPINSHNMSRVQIFTHTYHHMQPFHIKPLIQYNLSMSQNPFAMPLTPFTT